MPQSMHCRFCGPMQSVAPHIAVGSDYGMLAAWGFQGLLLHLYALRELLMH
jgi:hypothetical protein